jgi:zinc D-Ala-D-Ala carboxypeptidase
MMSATNVSDHITLGEATLSATAKARGIDNTKPSAKVLANMRHVAQTIFEPVRQHVAKNKKLYVSSFFRCALLNVAVGGSSSSQHVRGEAMDIDADVYNNGTNAEVFEYIRDHCNFDQLIIEGITGGKIAWVHVSAKLEGKNRKAILFMYKDKNGKTVYENYSLKRYKELVY